MNSFYFIYFFCFSKKIKLDSIKEKVLLSPFFENMNPIKVDFQKRRPKVHHLRDLEREY